MNGETFSCLGIWLLYIQVTNLHAPAFMLYLKVGHFSVGVFCETRVSPALLVKRKFLVICGKFYVEVNVKGRIKIMSGKQNRKCCIFGLLIQILTKDEEHIFILSQEPWADFEQTGLLLIKKLIVLVEEQVTSITKISIIIIIISTVISFKPLLVWLKVALNCSSKLSTLTYSEGKCMDKL